MRHDPKLDRLRSVPLFAEASIRDLRDLGAAGDVVTVDAGRFLQHAGARVGECFLVLDGELSLVVDGSEIARLGPGDLLGELEVMDGQPAATDAVAGTDVTALVVTAARLRALVDTNHAVRTAVVRQLARRARELAATA
jgi:CRP/FNR family cyclic AMP-dependent transcriptional regulator